MNKKKAKILIIIIMGLTSKVIFRCWRGQQQITNGVTDTHKKIKGEIGGVKNCEQIIRDGFKKHKTRAQSWHHSFSNGKEVRG